MVYEDVDEIKFVDFFGDTIYLNQLRYERGFWKEPSCNEYEYILAKFTNSSNEMKIHLELTPDNFSIDFFAKDTITSLKTIPNGYYRIAGNNTIEIIDENLLTNISIGQFNFENVLILESCINGKSSSIIYSLDKGIELLEVRLNNQIVYWLRLLE